MTQTSVEITLKQVGRHDPMSEHLRAAGAQWNGTHAQHCQRPKEWGLPQSKYYGSVKHYDPASSTCCMCFPRL